MSELDEYDRYNIPNWDSYGAEPISPVAVTNAKALLAVLKRAGLHVDVAPGGDGTIGFEFETAGGEFWLDIGARKIEGHVKRVPTDQ